MKKKLFISLALIIVIGGCLFYFIMRPKKTTCILKINQEPYDLVVTKYTIYSKDGLVTKVLSKQTVKSNDKKRLEEVKENINNNYKTLNDKYSGYSYKSIIIKNTLISTIIIDYKKVDMKKFTNDNGAMKEYVNDNKQFTLTGAKKYYKSIGANCK